MIAKCNEKSQHVDIPVSEKGRTFRLLNPSRKWVNKVHVDGCYITSGLRCDYLFEIDENAVHYVELKGTDISHAVKQLEATLESCRAEHGALSRYCHIVAARVPRALPSTQKFQKELKRKHDAVLDISTKERKVKI